ncbi:MAG: ArsR/SmtB family transcription factor [Bacilli bacterium]
MYDERAKVIKALSDGNRLKILDLLSCGEMCACDLLPHFSFTQPTLSHHLKVLVDAKLLQMRKKGTWQYYSLDMGQCNALILFLMQSITPTENCVCKQKTENGVCENGTD